MNETQRKQRVVIAGGSGFLGVSLATFLTERNWQVTLLSRKAPKVTGNWQHVEWNARTFGSWSEVLNGTQGIINLVGRSVDCIKTPATCDEILRSRVEATRVLGQAMRTIAAPPPVWVQMSTAHIYGDPPEVTCHEDAAYGYGLAPEVAKAWEAEFARSVLPEQRGVMLRTSFVIGRNRGAGGGALDRLRTLVRWGLGGTVGNGKQGMSWIHETDLNRLFERGLNNAAMQGAYIASAPQPVSQREFMRTLRRVLKMPIGLPASHWMVRLGAPLFMQTDPELAIYGRYVISQRLSEENFEFQFPQLEPALQELLLM